MGIYLIICSYFLSEADLFNDDASKGEITIIALVYLPILIYSPFFETLLKGKTLGKMILKTRVVKTNGKFASFGSILLRWMLKSIDFKIGLLFFFLAALFENTMYSNTINGYAGFFMLMPIPIIGLFVIIKSKNNQRLGDLAAETIVIHEKKRVSLDDTILSSKEEDYTPIFKEALKLRDKDIYIIKKVVDKAETELDHSAVLPLAEKAKKVLEIKSDLLPLILLKTLLKDYNYLAQKKDLE